MTSQVWIQNPKAINTSNNHSFLPLTTTYFNFKNVGFHENSNFQMRQHLLDSYCSVVELNWNDARSTIQYRAITSLCLPSYYVLRNFSLNSLDFGNSSIIHNSPILDAPDHISPRSKSSDALKINRSSSFLLPSSPSCSTQPSSSLLSTTTSRMCTLM